MKTIKEFRAELEAAARSAAQHGSNTFYHQAQAHVQTEMLFVVLQRLEAISEKLGLTFEQLNPPRAP